MDNTTKKSADNIAEDICEAIEIVVQQALGKLQYDQTIIATIIDDSKWNKGIYQVQNGNTKFEVYADPETHYKNKEQVRVSILNGDYSEKKFIIGKYTVETNQPIAYVAPDETLLDLTGEPLLKEEKLAIFEDDGIKEKLLLSETIPAGTYADKNLYDSLLVAAKIKSNLNKNIKYGLKIILNGEHILYFNSNEFLGNPRKFIISSKQQKIFNITDFEEIAQCEVYAWYEGELETGILEIALADLKIGGNLIYQNNKTATIYTPDGDSYTLDDTNLLRRLKLRWINKTDSNEYIGFSDGIYDENYSEDKYYEEVKLFHDLTAYTEITEWPMPNYRTGLLAWHNYQLAIPGLQEVEKRYGDLIEYLAIQADTALGTSFGLPSIVNTLIGRYELLKLRNKESQEEGTLLKWMIDAMAQAAAYETLSGSVDDPWGWYQNLINDIFDYGGLIPLTGGKYSLWGDKASMILMANPNQIAPYRDLEAKIKEYAEALNEALIKANSLSKVHSALIDMDAEDYGSVVEGDFDDSEYANRYCIYWYQKEDAAPGDAFQPEGWKRLESLDNKCLPGNDGEHLLASNAGTVAEVSLEADKQEMIYQAIVFYNHNRYDSNELKFLNLNAIDIARSTDRATALTIEHSKNSQDMYQLYDFTKHIMSKREAYCKRTIVANYSGLLGGNEMFNNSTLYWYIPKEEESMLKFDMIGKKEVPSDLVGYKKYECVLKDNSTEEDRSLTYTIKEYYSPKAAKNTIKCILQSSVIDSYTAEKSFTFASYGNNGTEYSIFVRPLDEDITTVSPNRDLSLLISAYDYEGKQIDLDPSSMSIVWSKDYKEQLELNKIDKDLYIIIPYIENEANYGHLTITLHGVKLSNGSNKDITTEYAIPYSTFEGCKLIGTTKIIYNSFGTEPVCDDNTPYAVYDIDNKELDLSKLTLSHNDYCILDSDNTLKANTMYTSSSNGYPILVIISADSLYPVWNQEIIVAQNRFGIPAVNDWDGEYGINDNGHVFAAILGVGQKDVNNRFTGMVMGEIGELKNNAQWGLYGFDKGVGTYGFRTDGSAFIGSDENNCIKVIQDNGAMTLQIKLNKLTLSAGLSDTDADNDFYLSNYETHNIDKRLVIGSNFAVDTKGNITANGGTIGGITINKDCLTSQSDIAYEVGDSFKATLVWNKSNTDPEVTVYDYGSTEEDIWINTPYIIPYGIEQVYVSGWGGKTEFFVMNSIPGANDSYKISAHAYSYNLTNTYTIKRPLGTVKDAKWYIIVNKKPTTIAEPKFTSSQSSFTISNNGLIQATNADISGAIKASSITAGSKSEIVGWEFDEEFMGLKDNITFQKFNNYDNYGIYIPGDVPSVRKPHRTGIFLTMVGVVPTLIYDTGEDNDDGTPKIKELNLLTLFP